MTPFRGPDDEFDGPLVIQFGDNDPFGPSLRYHDVVFDFNGSKGLGAFVVVEPGTTTLKGIELGDTRKQAQRAYPELRCGSVNEDSEYEPDPACAARLAPDHYIWFGGEPINIIALSTRKLHGL